VLRDSIANEKSFANPNATSLARMESDYEMISAEIIGALLKSHDRDRDRVSKLLPK
jgi:hypothetical protein